MRAEELTLGMIDNQRHLTTSIDIVQAVGFAVRAGHSDRTAYRFVTALVMLDRLQPRRWWAATLNTVMQLEKEEASDAERPSE